MITTIEGNSFSGKTSLAEELVTSFDAKIVPEYDVYVQGGKNFPAFPPDSMDDACKAIEFFVEVEKRRSGDAIELVEKSGKPVVMDRSPFSCIFFQANVLHQFKETPNAYLYSIERFLAEARSGNVFIPNSIVYLYPTIEQFRMRIERRGRVGIDFLNWESTLIFSHHWYGNLCRMYREKNSLMLQSSEDKINYDAYLVMEFLSQVDLGYDPKTILEELYLKHVKEKA